MPRRLIDPLPITLDPGHEETLNGIATSKKTVI